MSDPTRYGDTRQSKDVATMAAAWLWSATERFIENMYTDPEPEAMVDAISDVMLVMLPADPKLDAVADAHERLMRHYQENQHE